MRRPIIAAAVCGLAVMSLVDAATPTEWNNTPEQMDRSKLPKPQPPPHASAQTVRRYHLPSNEYRPVPPPHMDKPLPPPHGNKPVPPPHGSTQSIRTASSRSSSKRSGEGGEWYIDTPSTPSKHSNKDGSNARVGVFVHAKTQQQAQAGAR
ncbi:hypothetical protein SYNPS1DRAFT_26826 [Syncephalis pseudoplumigaleata]|uniref:Uncharacterized protein n=1 Tax=Syncephalis pseudoplumigaleata TaxID=1712513 RepID=A0A4P9Z511_9FUNG|nr:hypothetical protein SYNPS1DRAFT_26826 [Syncephalis pseudoplumigaleata]|eukprot:RKP27518.1 hypothetical protein SYNPS1DRAFT_26826 [Syncephalis pseudoplumigaleata]